ncbi:alpha/beta hydrolase [Paenibacillus psychroresistens]|uniref:Alpha/beta hydrolase n=1 Tax=Paenibacillus psychroresistens TaxID=1778678 RepID=A0A6B8RIV2_9BACL|nr:alpha/beta hydrolase-fold protein [Paenibacillus psychroresistens]QGQ95787.1 alpha/beta hydrolase [Paenibacillus psychroresistens]
MSVSHSIKGTFQEIFIERSIWVYLPPSYALSAKTYPVIYLQDGKRLIDPLVCSNIQIFESWFEQGTMAEFIIIAVEALHRNDEYTPWKSTKDSHLYGEFGGLGDAYLHYLTEIVKPLVDQHYRTLTDNLNTMIVGCSLGGLIAIYGGLQFPGIFGKVAGLSSSVWFEGFYDFASRMTLPANLQLYLDVSKAEGSNMLKSNQAFYELFKSSGFNQDKLHFHIAQAGKHTTEHFIKRLPDALEWLVRRSMPH